MIAVIFEVWPAADGGRDAYLGIAAELRKDLEQIDGFLSVERFQSLVDPDKMLSLPSSATRAPCWLGATWKSIVPRRSAGAAVCSPITGCAWLASCATTD